MTNAEMKSIDPENYRPRRGTEVRDARPGEELPETEVERIVEDVRASAGRPSLSQRGKSPSFNLRMPAATRARLDEVAAAQGRKPGEVARETLEEYLAAH